jgi:hypothetical protein
METKADVISERMLEFAASVVRFVSGIYRNTCLKNGLYLLSLSNDAIKVSSKLIIK